MIFRIVTADSEEGNKHRGWYRTSDSTKVQTSINVQFPKSKWDSEAEEGEIADENETQGTPRIREGQNVKHSATPAKSGKMNLNFICIFLKSLPQFFR